MTPQQLKNAILQQAIQGKLVEQRAEEGTGQELYKVIQDEKQKLIQEGKLKKQKALPEITEDEIPFEIPETWKWVRLGEISTYSQTKKKINVAAIETPMWSLDLEDIEKESGKIIRRVMTIDRKISGEKIIFKKDQILYSKLRPYLKKILIAPDNGVCSSELVPFDMIGNCDSRFIVYLLKSAYVDFLINSVTYGVKMPRVGTDTMINLLIPLPPLAEQERIVEKIEEFLPLVERYEKAWARLEELNKKFPLDMQKAILGQAIQGKLVEQRAEEGTGQELYKAIQDEKQKLIQEGKLKKQKALPEITEDEIPFEIPETWKWVRLGEIVTVYGGKRIPVGKKLSLTKTEHVYIRVSDMKDGFVSTENLQYISDDIYEKISNYIIKKEDVYITVAGTIGRIGKIPYELDGANLTENADRLVFSAINQDWLIKTLQSNLVQQQIISSTTKVGQPKLAISRIQTILIPLPPLAEQERIVEKIEELLPLVEKLK
ncbi:restriction endonuclease subunit S [Streptococcus infantis]|uniref:restriction endonuclease subunit S n=1 Tax=Streptococcus infantis TaxID=68892 RepID=UPI0039C04E6B